MKRFRVLAPESLNEKVAAQIRDAISAGRLAPGERLVEAGVAAEMGISRAPVREALRRLEFEGLLVARPRRGYVIRDLSVDALHEIYDLRVLLEPILARCAAERIQADDVPALGEVVERMRDAGRRDDWAEVVNADREFHMLVGKLSGRPLTAQVFEHLNEQVRTFMALLRGSYPHPGEMAVEHEDLLNAIASGDGERAERGMRSHLEDARRQLASTMDGNRGSDGRPQAPCVEG